MTTLMLGPRFWRHVRFGSCFEWQGGTNAKGYGRYWIGERGYSVHRLVWEVINGPIPEGMCVLHHCDHPGCVNPRHLWLGTAGENNTNRAAKNRGLNGGKNHRARLTEDEVRSLRRDHAAGATGGELSRKYGVHRAHALRIGRGLEWRHVPSEAAS